LLDFGLSFDFTEDAGDNKEDRGESVFLLFLGSFFSLSFLLDLDDSDFDLVDDWVRVDFLSIGDAVLAIDVVTLVTPETTDLVVKFGVYPLGVVTFKSGRVRSRLWKAFKFKLFGSSGE